MASSDGTARDHALALEAIHRRACEAHPDLAVDLASFRDHLRACLAVATAAPAAVLELNGPDLLLACGCARGDARALERFDATVLARVGQTLGRRVEAAHIDDVKQLVRSQLFVADAGRPPRITEYCGQGSLLTWVRVVALRAAATLQRGARRGKAREQKAAALEPTEVLDGVDLVHLRRRHAADLKAAFEIAIAELEPRARTLLRQHLVDRLTIDDLGTLYRVDRVTAARWLTRARTEVASLTRRVLGERLRVSDTELESLGRLVRSELDLSLERVLGT